MVDAILSQMGWQDPVLKVSQFLSEEDGTPYQVWKVKFADKLLVLKEAKGYEYETYRAYFSGKQTYAPKLCGATAYNGKEYLLMAYIPGQTMMRCTRSQMIVVLDALIAMQNAFWDSDCNAGYCYSKALEGRENRANYLHDPLLKSVYAQFLEKFQHLTRTLCHDDLLPFNVICNDSSATFIDWEYGGILPYPVSLARLLAHGEEADDAFFYMRQDDRDFALEYYYENFVKCHGITKNEYERTMDLFLFYEYCEWIYVGNKYGNTDNDRYRAYLQKATAMANKIHSSRSGE